MLIAAWDTIMMGILQEFPNEATEWLTNLSVPLMLPTGAQYISGVCMMAPFNPTLPKA